MHDITEVRSGRRETDNFTQRNCAPLGSDPPRRLCLFVSQNSDGCWRSPRVK